MRTYDDKGNLTAMIDAAGGTTTYAYDHNGAMTALTDANAKTTSWTYDATGQQDEPDEPHPRRYPDHLDL